MQRRNSAVAVAAAAAHEHQRPNAPQPQPRPDAFRRGVRRSPEPSSDSNSSPSPAPRAAKRRRRRPVEPVEPDDTDADSDDADDADDSDDSDEPVAPVWNGVRVQSAAELQRAGGIVGELVRVAVSGLRHDALAAAGAPTGNKYAPAVLWSAVEQMREVVGADTTMKDTAKLLAHLLVTSLDVNRAVNRYFMNPAEFSDLAKHKAAVTIDLTEPGGESSASDDDDDDDDNNQQPRVLGKRRHESDDEDIPIAPVDNLGDEEMEDADPASPASAPRSKRLRVDDPVAPVSTNCAMCATLTPASMLMKNPTCEHSLCVGCANKFGSQMVASKTWSDFTCPVANCSAKLDDGLFQQILSSETRHALSEGATQAFLAQWNLLQCPNQDCNARMEFVPRDHVPIPPEMKERDDKGDLLSREAFVHFSKHRVRCRECLSDFCSECSMLPYHKGRTCEQVLAYNAARHCRFCNGALPQDVGLHVVACNEADCQKYAAAVCEERLECGHLCCGIKGEAEHIPCLDDECEAAKAAASAPGAQSGSDFCNICFVEALNDAPCIKLDCGHMFHQHCVHSLIDKGYPGMRITFKYLDCPLCKKTVSHPSLRERLAPILARKAEIEKRAMARLKREDLLKHEKITNSGSAFHNDPLGFAMASYAYYSCYKCNSVYFGGRRDCEQNANAAGRDKKEFVCFDCSDLKSVSCTVPSHREYHLWKCRFCCSAAVWFCWGTTHFCDECHKRPSLVVNARPEDFVQCKGPEHCALGVEHPPNGPRNDSEFCLGCAICAEKRHEHDVELELAGKKKKKKKKADDDSSSSSSSASASKPKSHNRIDYDALQRRKHQGGHYNAYERRMQRIRIEQQQRRRRQQLQRQQLRQQKRAAQKQRRAPPQPKPGAVRCVNFQVGGPNSDERFEHGRSGWWRCNYCHRNARTNQMHTC